MCAGFHRRPLILRTTRLHRVGKTSGRMIAIADHGSVKQRGMKIPSVVASRRRERPARLAASFASPACSLCGRRDAVVTAAQPESDAAEADDHHRPGGELGDAPAGETMLMSTVTLFAPVPVVVCAPSMSPGPVSPMSE